MAIDPHRLAGLHILLVEDEWFIASDLAQAFAKGGAEVLGPVPDVAGALALVADAERIDAALLDINLRGEMAFPVADALERRGVPFVFATGYDQAKIPPRYAHVRRCEKPVEPESVMAAMFG